MSKSIESLSNIIVSGIYEYELDGEIKEAAYLSGNPFAYDKESGNKVSVSALGDFVRKLDRFELELYEEEYDDGLEEAVDLDCLLEFDDSDLY